MNWIILIVVIILLAIFGFWYMNNQLAVNNMIWHFKHCNVINYGAKGTGKDLITDYVIRKRKDMYYCNIDHSLKSRLPREIIGLKDVSVYPNTYYQFINQDYQKIPRRFYDGKDIYISDVGNFLPSYMDSSLHKYFPSMPLIYSLSRHLYGNNIHCNSQSLERSWKALREQADFFVWSRRTYKLFGLILITKCISYDRYDSANKKLLPLKVRWFNKQSKVQYDLFKAQNGDIRQFYVIQFARKVSYDTRAFEKLVFEQERLIFKRKDYIFPVDTETSKNFMLKVEYKLLKENSDDVSEENKA